jgi:hypothetical protein
MRFFIAAGSVAAYSKGASSFNEGRFAMADPKPGQFGSKENDASMAGEKGAKAQSTGAKAKGGRNSHRGSQSDSDSS